MIDLQETRSPKDSETALLFWKNILQEIINMANCNTWNKAKEELTIDKNTTIYLFVLVTVWRGRGFPKS
jgi:hypothetical protein